MNNSTCPPHPAAALSEGLTMYWRLVVSVATHAVRRLSARAIGGMASAGRGFWPLKSPKASTILSGLSFFALNLCTAALFGPPGIVALASSPGQMIYGESTRLDSFDPYTVHELPGQRLADLLFDNLIDAQAGGDYKPGLALSWQIEDGGSAVSLRLRPAVPWHISSNEKAPAPFFTADDVVATIRLLTAPNSDIPNQERFRSLKGAEKLSDHHVRVYFHRALRDPLRALQFKILPAHLTSSGGLRRDSAFARHPVGTGPYRFVKANAQGEILLTANPRYFRGRPQIERIIMKSYADLSIMTQALMYDALDLVTYVSPHDLGEVLGDSRLDVVPYDAQSFNFLAMNTGRGPLRDKRVRQAICHAINRQEMLQAFFHGRGRLISGPFAPTSWAYNMDVQPLGFDSERARKLLAAANIDGRLGLKSGDQGNHFKLIFAVPLAGEHETIKRLALALRSYLETVGLEVDLRFMDWALWKRRVLADHDYDLTLGSWSFDDTSNITSLFHSAAAKPWGNNFVQFHNQQVDSLLTEADITNDFDKRRAIYHKLHAILTDEAPYAYLWSLQHHAAHTPRISGVRIEPFGFFKYIVAWHADQGGKNRHGPK